MATRLPFSGEQYWNACKRNAFKGTKMYTYEAGTTTTLKTTWTAADESVEHPNPVLADANGIFPEVYGNGSFYIKILNNAEDELVYEADNISGQGVLSITAYGSLISDAVPAIGNVGDFIETFEYSSGTASGGGKYEIVSLNPGNNLVNPQKTDGSGNYLKLIPQNGVILASQAGALGLGIVDESSNANQLILTAIALNVDAVFDLTAVGYRLVTPILAASPVTIRGPGKLLPDDQIINAIDITSDNVSVFDLDITGKGKSHDDPTRNQGNGIFALGADGAPLKNITIEGGNYSNCHNNILLRFVEDYSVTDTQHVCTTDGLACISAYGSPHGIISDNRGSGDDQMANLIYVLTEPGATTQTTDLVITDNVAIGFQFEAFTMQINESVICDNVIDGENGLFANQAGIEITPNLNPEISGNTVSNNKISNVVNAIRIVTNTNKTIVNDNNVNGTSGDAIQITTGTDNVKATGNIIDDCGGVGIINFASNSDISHNTITNTVDGIVGRIEASYCHYDFNTIDVVSAIGMTINSIGSTIIGNISGNGAAQGIVIGGVDCTFHSNKGYSNVAKDVQVNVSATAPNRGSHTVVGAVASFTILSSVCDQDSTAMVMPRNALAATAAALGIYTGAFVKGSFDVNGTFVGGEIFDFIVES